MQELKLIVAGGREFNDYVRLSGRLVELEMLYPDNAISLVSGMARGADALAVRFAREHNVKLYEFPADWNTHGKSAGFIRNKAMAEFSDVLLAFWDGESRGTAHMLNTMKAMGKPVHLERY